MIFFNTSKTITLEELVRKDGIKDETIITVSRMAVNLRVMELSSSTTQKSQNILSRLTDLLTSTPKFNYSEDIESHFHLSAKETKLLFHGMKYAPRNSFSISGSGLSRI